MCWHRYSGWRVPFESLFRRLGIQHSISVPMSLKVVQDRPHFYLFDLRYLAGSIKMDEKIPEATFTAAKGAEGDKVTTTCDAMLRLRALAQRTAHVRIVMYI